MSSLSAILKGMIEKGDRDHQIRYRTLQRGLNLIYTPPVDDNGPAVLRLSRRPEIISPLHTNPPQYREVYPSKDEVKAIKAALKYVISRASFNSLRQSDPYVVPKKGSKFGSVRLTWYRVTQREVF